MRVGAYVTSGSVNRDSQDDLVMLAAGARAGQGELQLYYGGNRAVRTGVIDLAAGVARRFFASPSPGPLGTAAVFEVTGEGARDVMVGVPSASGGGLGGNGLVYFSLSPRMRLSPKSITLQASRVSREALDSGPQPRDWQRHVECDIERAVADGQSRQRSVERSNREHSRSRPAVHGRQDGSR